MVVHAPKSKPLMQSYWFHPECNCIHALKILLAAFSSSDIVTAMFFYEYIAFAISSCYVSVITSLRERVCKDSYYRICTYLSTSCGVYFMDLAFLYILISQVLFVLIL